MQIGENEERWRLRYALEAAHFLWGAVSRHLGRSKLAEHLLSASIFNINDWFEYRRADGLVA